MPSVIVSFTADEQLFPTTGSPPGERLAKFLVQGLQDAGVSSVETESEPGYGWLYWYEADVTVVSTLRFAGGDAPRWEVRADGTVPQRRQLLRRRPNKRRREAAVHRWLTMTLELLESSRGFGAITSHDPRGNDRSRSTKRDG
jgi:hypothetical protein